LERLVALPQHVDHRPLGREVLEQVREEDHVGGALQTLAEGVGGAESHLDAFRCERTDPLACVDGDAALGADVPEEEPVAGSDIDHGGSRAHVALEEILAEHGPDGLPPRLVRGREAVGVKPVGRFDGRAPPCVSVRHETPPLHPVGHAIRVSMMLSVGLLCNRTRTAYK
jgi:hypothetical protein